ncbi:hypothetical protein BDZ89DRAFT_1068042 [Hymenopellis radicata]|nr:hypothetical protein BDZ89DRAFT_1068042 [Hymenopellis radicata]
MTVIRSSSLLFIVLTLPVVLAEQECENNDEKKCDTHITVAVGIAIGISSLVVILLLVSAIYVIRRRKQAEQSNVTFEIEPSQIAGPPPSVPQITPKTTPKLPATTYNPAYDPAVPGKSERIRANLSNSKLSPSSSLDSTSYVSSKTKYPFIGYSSKNPPPVTPDGKF